MALCNGNATGSLALVDPDFATLTMAEASCLALLSLRAKAEFVARGAVKLHGHTLVYVPCHRRPSGARPVLHLTPSPSR